MLFCYRCFRILQKKHSKLHFHCLLWLQRRQGGILALQPHGCPSWLKVSLSVSRLWTQGGTLSFWLTIALAMQSISWMAWMLQKGTNHLEASCLQCEKHWLPSTRDTLVPLSKLWLWVRSSILFFKLEMKPFLDDATGEGQKPKLGWVGGNQSTEGEGWAGAWIASCCGFHQRKK